MITGTTFQNIDDPDRKSAMDPLDVFNYDNAVAQFTVSPSDCIGIQCILYLQPSTTFKIVVSFRAHSH